jgi:flotillin
MTISVLIIMVLALLGIVIIFSIIKKKHTHIVKEGELLVLSGQSYKSPNGTTIGFRWFTEGKVYRKPLIETFSVMDISKNSVAVMVKNAYTKHQHCINLSMEVTYAISTKDSIIVSAIERFLGRSQKEMDRVASETFEGHLRPVIYSYEPIDIKRKTFDFEQRMIKDVRESYNKLGLEIVGVKFKSLEEIH